MQYDLKCMVIFAWEVFKCLGIILGEQQNLNKHMSKLPDLYFPLNRRMKICAIQVK